MKQIPLTQGQFAIVDDKLFDWLNQWKWHIISCNKSNNLLYAARTIYDKKTQKRKPILMQREILHLNIDDPREIMHKNFNTLDNRIKNLQIGSHSECLINQKKCNALTSSKYKGVCFQKGLNKWRAYVWKDYKQYPAGCFDIEEDAARARDKLVLELFGDNVTRLNFPKEA